MAYGTLGLLVLGSIGLVGARSFGSLEPLSSSLESERVGLVTSLRATSAALSRASASAGRFRSSLSEAKASASGAATLARSMGLTLDGLAAASDLEILGNRPLGGLGQGFGQAAGQARDLASTLDAMAVALDRNSTDLSGSEGDLATVRSDVSAMADQVAAMPPFADTAAGAGALRWAFLGLLAWLLIPAVASLGAGVWLWRDSAAL